MPLWNAHRVCLVCFKKYKVKLFLLLMLSFCFFFAFLKSISNSTGQALCLNIKQQSDLSKKKVKTTRRDSFFASLAMFSKKQSQSLSKTRRGGKVLFAVVRRFFCNARPFFFNNATGLWLSLHFINFN